jgi:hypothetical protein
MHPSVLAIAALVFALVACGERAATQVGPSAESLDRERRAVFAAVLDQAYVERGLRRLVVEPRMLPAYPLTVEGEPAVGLRPTPVSEQLPEATPDAVADFAASVVTPLPRDLVAALPIDWLDETGWDGLPRDGDSLEERWFGFHRRFPGSAGWIIFSRIGLSKDLSQALVAVSSVRGELDGSGLLVLLEKERGVWRIRTRRTTWVS